MNRFAVCLLAAVATASCSKDDIAPVVELAGRNPDTVYVRTFAEYPDPGAKGTDGEDGEVDVIVSGGVNMAQPGHYVITYTAKDKNDNVSQAVHRHVEVIKAEGAYAATESCSSSGAGNYTATLSTGAGYDTVTLAGFPIATYMARAVVTGGGFRIFPQTVSPVMDLEGLVTADGATLTVTYTRTSLMGPGTTETCTAVLRR
jgi:hypothetical protein